MKTSSHANAKPQYRVLNRDGTHNVDRSNKVHGAGDLYHLILSMKWWQFVLMTTVAYVGLNMLFAGFYFVAGPGGLTGTKSDDQLQFLVDCFFFSVQTFSTIGYGTISPHGFFTNTLVSVEAFTGMMSIAVMSGLLFARFSRPTAKVHFSQNALITTYLGKRCLIFRLANARLNQIVEADVSAVVLFLVKSPDGSEMRRQFDLPLIRSHSQFFAASWTVAHEINESSPLWNLSLEELERVHAEILISARGFDETFSQTIYARFSYLYSEILVDRNFKDILSRRGHLLHIDLERISELQ